MSEPSKPETKPFTVEELRKRFDQAKRQQLSPETKKWMEDGMIDDPFMQPEIIARAKALGVEIPKD